LFGGAFVEHWRKTGGPFASINGCGNVITNWLGRSGSHSQYGSKVDASEDLDVARATFEAPLLECTTGSGDGSGDDDADCTASMFDTEEEAIACSDDGAAGDKPAHHITSHACFLISLARTRYLVACME
jgi:hypothetical protein